MQDWFTGLTMLEKVYLCCAALGSVFVAMRIVFMAVGGGGHDGGMDHDMGGHDMGGHDAAGHDSTDSDSDAGFRALSIHGLSAFFLMFGLVGFAVSRQFGNTVYFSLLGASLAGLASVWVISRIYGAMYALQSSGTLPISAARGCRGEVYLTIPAQGKGRVTVTVRERLREYDAVADGDESLPTGTRIQVMDVEGDTLVVARVQRTQS